VTLRLSGGSRRLTAGVTLLVVCRWVRRRTVMANIPEKVSRSNDWLTPHWILGGVERAFDEDISYDPCPCRLCPDHLGGWYDKEGTDGLEAVWHDGTFVNPPFSLPPGTKGPSPVYAWIAKCCKEAEKGHKIALLLPVNRMEQERRLRVYGSRQLTATVNLYKRVKFINAETGEDEGGNMYPTELLFFNCRSDLVQAAFGSLGMVRHCYPEPP
jgi:hypothetical protein